MNSVDLSRVECTSSRKLVQDAGGSEGDASAVNTRARKRNKKRCTSVLLSMMALAAICITLIVVCKYASHTTNASKETSEPHRNAEVGQYFDARRDNSDHETTGVIGPGPNLLLQRYIMSNLLTGEDRQHKIDALLQIVENDVAADNSSITPAREFAEIIQASSMTKDDVINLAYQYEGNNHHFLSAILFYSATKTNPDPCDNDTSGTTKGLQGMLMTSQRLAQTRGGNSDIVREYVLPLMDDVLNDARKVTCESHDVTIKRIASCLRVIALTYDAIGDDVTFANKSEEAAQFVGSALGDEASSYNIYALCLDTVAVANYKLREYRTALVYYRRTLSAAQTAMDWEDEEDKDFFINTTGNNIKAIEQLIVGSEET